jgi:hypothetical protein
MLTFSDLSEPESRGPRVFAHPLPARLNAWCVRLSLIQCGVTAAGNRVFEFVGPAQWREPSLSVSTKTPTGMRGGVSSSGMVLPLHRSHRLSARPTACQDGPRKPSQYPGTTCISSGGLLRLRRMMCGFLRL